jgi:hypothetical protein
MLKLKKVKPFWFFNWDSKKHWFCSIDRFTISIDKDRRYYCHRRAVSYFSRKHQHWNNRKNLQRQTNQFYTLDVKLFNDMTNLGHVFFCKRKIVKKSLVKKRKKDE